ncbi:acyl-CoA thioesterase [Chitiniphilus purpureus]|uniref:Acyl-CoA thioesterase n=1 Tax=Chitiniphilus purpureus TaxID=2981137 RepID=A0ABY6DQL6_9NEIS|nr:thioesterase family protein [Chitiniphilus sp. CD1]UXY16664.1 acyl-CoA thioesterase [Chitiniphilus sp. CD1]
MPHFTRLKVRGYHLDLYGHVNNARYLEFLEEARWNMMEEAGRLDFFMQSRLALVVSRIDIHYKRPAGMGDELVIETRLASLGERHGVISQRILRADNEKLVAHAEVSFAVLHPEQPGALPLTGAIAEALTPLLEAV